MKRIAVLITTLLALFVMLGSQSQVSGRGQPGDVGNPIGQLKQRIAALEQALSELESRVETLEESQGQGQVTRTVYARLLDPGTPHADEVVGRAETYPDGSQYTMEHHYAEFSVSDASLADPPLIQLQHRPLPEQESFAEALSSTSAYCFQRDGPDGLEILVWYKTAHVWVYPDGSTQTTWGTLLAPDDDGLLPFRLVVIY